MGCMYIVEPDTKKICTVYKGQSLSWNGLHYQDVIHPTYNN